MQQTSPLSYFKTSPQPPNLQQPPPWSVSSHHCSQGLHQQKHLFIEGSDECEHF
jgi:hypothetical protein